MNDDKSEITPIEADEQQPGAGENSNQVVVAAVPNQEPVPRIFKLNIDCFEELFEYLSLKDLFELRLTCKEFKKRIDGYVKLYYPAIRMGYVNAHHINESRECEFQVTVNAMYLDINIALSHIEILEVIKYTETLSRWTSLNGELTPTNMKSQKEWDTIIINRIVGSLLLATDQDKARYNASLAKESNGWLTVLPSKFVGTLLDNNTFRISIALRLGCDICIPHKCKCGKNVDKSGIHGLSCKFSAGRLPRHSGFNNTICRTLHTANFPAKLEPPLYRKDRKRADGVTLIPWSNGKMLVWDATIRDTLAPSYVHSSSVGPGRVATRAAADKCNNYKNLIDDNYIFLPFACETLGPWCAEALQFSKQLGKMVSMATGEPKSELYFKQRISIELQRTNAASVMGTFDTSSKLDEIFYILSTNM